MDMKDLKIQELWRELFETKQALLEARVQITALSQQVGERENLIVEEETNKDDPDNPTELP